MGEIVHYVSYGSPGGEFSSQCRAAIITEIREKGDVRLVAINPAGIFFHNSCRYEWHPDGVSYPRGGTWHYMEPAE